MQGKAKYYFESLRLERWPRSLAIVPGFIAALVLESQLSSSNSLLSLTLCLATAFFLTLLISTSNYIVNEIADAPFDAHHPGKKDRPLVRKVISVNILMLLWLIMVVPAFVIGSIFFNTSFILSLASLLVAGLLYNIPPIRVKDIPFLDSTLESANNPIRLLIGWFILTSSIPPISLLISWWAFGNFLMVGKRVAEKKFLSPEESAGYRLSLKKYSIKNLIIFMLFNSLIFIITFSLFAIETKMYTLLVSVPFVLFYLGMFMKKTVQDRDGAEEPEKLLKDPYFAFYTLFLIGIFILAYLLK